MRRRNRRPFRPIRRKQIHTTEPTQDHQPKAATHRLETYLSDTSSPIRSELAPFDAAFFSPPEVLTSHTRTVQSSPPLTSSEDSELKDNEVIGWVWPLIVLISWPCNMSQSLIVRSCASGRTSQQLTLQGRERNSHALARYRPFGLMARQSTASLWPKKTRTHSPRWTSHSRQVLSLDPVARYSEFGWNFKH